MLMIFTDVDINWHKVAKEKINPEDHKDVIFSIFKRYLISKYCDI